jgi:hypothetical protein
MTHYTLHNIGRHLDKYIALCETNKVHPANTDPTYTFLVGAVAWLELRIEQKLMFGSCPKRFVTLLDGVAGWIK